MIENLDRFKFRFWDIERKIMLYPKIDKYSISYQINDTQSVDLSFMFSRPNSYIPMQSAVIKDRDYKLIYESDILGLLATKARGYSCKEGTRLTQTVIFGKYILRNDSLYNFTGMYCSSTPSMQYFLDQGAIVIGNIYENTELLEVKND